MAYVTTTELEYRLPWIGSFGANSKPTSTAVADWITTAQAIVDGNLAAGNITAPADGTNGARILGELVLDYVEGRVRLARDAMGDTDGGDIEQDGVFLISQFNATMLDIRQNPDKWSATINGADSDSGAVHVRAYTLSNIDSLTVSDGDFAPIFERETTVGDKS